jgi:hypothetical protein
MLIIRSFYRLLYQVNVVLCSDEIIEDYSLLGCDAVQFDIYQRFQRMCCLYLQGIS